jgi:hypothetical protein
MHVSISLGHMSSAYGALTTLYDTLTNIAQVHYLYAQHRIKIINILARYMCCMVVEGKEILFYYSVTYILLF